jgi:hypothetical protein
LIKERRFDFWKGEAKALSRAWHGENGNGEADPADGDEIDGAEDGEDMVWEEADNEYRPMEGVLRAGVAGRPPGTAKDAFSSDASHFTPRLALHL